MVGNRHTTLGTDLGDTNGGDVGDRSNVALCIELEAAIATALAQVHRGTASAVRCVLCEEDIPPERQEAIEGVQTCINCQRESESNGSAIVNGDATFQWGDPDRDIAPNNDNTDDDFEEVITEQLAK